METPAEPTSRTLRPRVSIAVAPAALVIVAAATLKFAMHLYMVPGYGFFGDELYTIALSHHLAWGYVDLPPLVPAMVALSRLLLGESLLAMHIFPALAGAFTLVLVCLITRELGGKTFAVGFSALCFLLLPQWLVLNAAICYDGIDQLVLAGFLYTLVRLLKSGNRKLWVVMGAIAGIACLTKLTLLFLGPGLLLALMVSRYRRDLLTPWPWLGVALFAVIVSPYVLWQIANNWTTLDYWRIYTDTRLAKTDLLEYLTNVLVWMNPLLLPLWIVGLYRVFRRFGEISFAALGILVVAGLAGTFSTHAPTRMVAELFIPLVAASASSWRKGYPQGAG